MKKVAILGAGSWGTALAALLAQGDRPVCLWGNDPKRIAEVEACRQNRRYLPGVHLSGSILATNELAAVREADLIVFVTPSIALRAVAKRLRESGIRENAVLLSCTKGIEHVTGSRMSQILGEIFPPNPVAVLSGPNLAAEIVRGLPTATVVGCADERIAEKIQQTFGTERFRIYTSNDVTSIELGGALKNVYAIGAGISDGLDLGDNSKSALVTRALAELLRLGTAMGGNPRTFYGLSGVGDLVATCFSKLSRNRGVGERLGRGDTLAAIRSQTATIAEGVPTTESAYECARSLKVDTPIIDQLYQILYRETPIKQAMQELLGRDQKAERW